MKTKETATFVIQTIMLSRTEDDYVYFIFFYCLHFLVLDYQVTPEYRNICIQYCYTIVQNRYFDINFKFLNTVKRFLIKKKMCHKNSEHDKTDTKPNLFQIIVLSDNI